MKLITKFSVFAAFVLQISQVSAQNIGFVEIENVSKQSALMPRINKPEKYKIFHANFQSINDYLLQAPEEGEGFKKFTIKLPNANGDLVEYQVYNSPVLEDELAAATPGVYSYIAHNTKDLSNNIRIAVSKIHGIHIMGYNGNGETYYIDTYTQDLNSYILYKKADIVDIRTPFECLSDQESHQEPSLTGISNTTFSVDRNLRRYRVAMACTTEYATFHINRAPASTPRNTEAQQKDIVISAMNVTLNRLNVLYERDLAVRFQLIANNRNLVFIANDEFDNDNANTLINQSHNVINTVIGSANYDVGHTVSTGAGGLAGLGVICSNFSKGRGVTGSSAPVGDPFDIDYVAHEFGHQFGAQHTFNGNGGSCQGNRAQGVSAEPGSGSTIMAYAGICAANENVQRNSDAYFHYYSLGQIEETIVRSGNCAVVVNSTNSLPTVWAGNDYTIPKQTPFKLVASASDGNNPTTLSYTFEQLDSDFITYPMNGSNALGPNFRSIAPKFINERYFPELATVLRGTAALNIAPGTNWERLPSVARSMRFGVTVRDNNSTLGGLTARDDMRVTVANVGPFVVTNPENITNSIVLPWTSNTNQNITWNVAGTTGNGINTSHVHIYYTIDEGRNFTMLLENTPNNGSATVTVPLVPNGSLMRFMIKPVNNIYYALSRQVRIVSTLNTDEFKFDEFVLYPNPTEDVVNVSFLASNSDKVLFSLFDMNGRLLQHYEVEHSGMVNESLSLQNISSGIYLLKIENGDKFYSTKIVKK